MSTPVLDETTRPKAPKINGITDAQRRQGQQLAMIHRMHLQQIEQVEAIMAQIEAGNTKAHQVAEAVAGLEMIRNYRLFGNLCGQECQLLTFHHTAEDRQIFPALMQGSEGLRRVVERLMYEHTIIHALLEELETRAVALLQSPEQDNFTALSETFRQLAATVRSHFGYEETELEEAIGYHGIRV